MGDRSIKKETKKPKKSDKKAMGTASPSAPKQILAQPELVKKPKKIK